jgi:hypothetical protein
MGTALFDAVAISGTEAKARAGQCGDAQLGRVSADGVRRPIAMGVAASACAQDGGGVVRMADGAVTFKGGSISNSTAVRAPSASRASVRRGMVCWRGAARPMDGAHGVAHACCGEWCTVYGALSRSGACECSFRIVGEGATPSGRGVLRSGACGTRCACARHTPRGEGSKPEGCKLRLALHDASARVACYLHQSLTYLCCIGLCCIGLCCIGLCCIGLCCIGLCCIGLCCSSLCCMLQTRSRPAAPLPCDAL